MRQQQRQVPGGETEPETEPDTRDEADIYDLFTISETASAAVSARSPRASDQEIDTEIQEFDKEIENDTQSVSARPSGERCQRCKLKKQYLVLTCNRCGRRICEDCLYSYNRVNDRAYCRGCAPWRNEPSS